jgi:hypothetical protein
VEIASEETQDPPTWTRNARLGRFTNFVNLLDMCGVAVPAGLIQYDASHVPEVCAIMLIMPAARVALQQHICLHLGPALHIMSDAPHAHAALPPQMRSQA